MDDEALVEAFLAPPLRARAFGDGFGTLYTAAMRPCEGVVDYRWPGTCWRVSLRGPLCVTRGFRLQAA